MVKPVSENKYYRISVLREIFNQDISGNFTDKSLHYHYIIRYFLKDVHSYFKVRDVVNEIIEYVPLRTKNIQKGYDPNQNKSDIVGDRENIQKVFSTSIFMGNTIRKTNKRGKGHRLYL